jgi:hypothetical protein
MPDTILDGDFTIYYAADNNQKSIRWTGPTNGTRTFNEFYSEILKLFDDPAQMDDEVPIQAVTPDIYRMINQWFIQDEVVEHLTGGSIFSLNWVDGTDEHVLIIGADFATGFDPNDVGRTIVGGTTSDTGTILDVNSGRGLIWIRPDDPAVTTGDEFDDGDEAYSIQNDPAADATFEDVGTGFTNQTTGFNDATDANWTVFPSSEATGDYAAIGFWCHRWHDWVYSWCF